MNKIIRYRFFIIIAVFSFCEICAQTYRGFSNEDVQSMHEKWNLDNWDDGGELSRYTFLNMGEFWTHTVINRNRQINTLIEDPQSEIANFITHTKLGDMSLQDYVDNSNTDGIIVLHGNRIVFEAYPMSSFEKHTYMSVSKVFTSTLVAILEERDLLDVSNPIDFYLPELKGSGWENVPVIDILDMASGIGCIESVKGAYDNPETCYYQFDAAFGLFKRTEKTAETPWDYVKSLSSHKPSGEVFEYSSINTFILSMLIERITGLSYSKNIETEIWQKMGAESDAIMARNNGTDISYFGLSSTLRDLARFGYMFLPEARLAEDNFISESYMNKIQKEGRPKLLTAFGSKDFTLDGELPHHNTYQWGKVMEDGDFYKNGYGGQGLYISPSRNLVIAFFGTLDTNGEVNQLPDIARQIVKSVLLK